jgi:iron complex transport system permease protein
MSSKPDLSSQTLPLHLARWHGRTYAIVGLFAILVVVAALATTVGSVKIPLLTTCQILVSKLPLVHINPAQPSAIETIILEIRLPRIILAGLVGAALATAGATYQGLFRNPLADTRILLV